MKPKFIISVKDKKTGRDILLPFIVATLSGFADYASRMSSLGFVVLVDSMDEFDSFEDLPEVSNSLNLQNDGEQK